MGIQLGKRTYTNIEFILRVAQKDGSTHEDRTVDETIDTLGGRVKIGPNPMFVVGLCLIADQVLIAANKLMVVAYLNGDLRPLYWMPPRFPQTPGSQVRATELDAELLGIAPPRKGRAFTWGGKQVWAIPSSAEWYLYTDDGFQKGPDVHAGERWEQAVERLHTWLERTPHVKG
jgi:hypothetical protein